IRRNGCDADVNSYTFETDERMMGFTIGCNTGKAHHSSAPRVIAWTLALTSSCAWFPKSGFSNQLRFGARSLFANNATNATIQTTR
ncbi:MAG: hypothetical protein WC365_06460, partial [Candidatus Babeliales bacterium]